MPEPRSNHYTTRVQLPQNNEFWPVLVELEMSPSTRVPSDANGQPEANRTIPPAANDAPACELSMRSDSPSDGSRPSDVGPQSNSGRRVVSFLIPDSHRARVEKVPQPQANEPALINVDRLERAIRRTALKFQLFQSEGDFPLQSPPDLSEFQWIPAPFDVYYHKATGGDRQQLWIWAVNKEIEGWKSVEEGFECRAGPFAKRFLVLTQKNSPSWVSVSTVQRTYPHILTAAAKVGGKRT